MRDVGSARPRFLRPWLMWTLGFLSFPLAGLAAIVVAGRIDSPLAAVTGGAIARTASNADGRR